MSFESFESFILFDLSFRVNSSIQESSSQASRDQFLWAAGSTVDHASSMKSSERLVPQRHSGKVRLGVFLLFSSFFNPKFRVSFRMQNAVNIVNSKNMMPNDAKLQCKSLTSSGRVDGWQKRVGDGVNDLVHMCPHKHGSSAQHYDTHRHTVSTSLAMTTLQALPRLPTMFLDQTLSWLTTSDGKPNTVTWRSGDAGNIWQSLNSWLSCQNLQALSLNF